jgi:hypothetical protein
MQGFQLLADSKLTCKLGKKLRVNGKRPSGESALASQAEIVLHLIQRRRKQREEIGNR